jgi:hypothetical protein
MANTVLEKLNTEQLEIYQSMSKAWQKEADAALKLRDALVHDVIWRKYSLGEIVRRMRGNEAHYGTAAVETLAKVMGESKEELWSVQRLATCWTKESLEKFLATGHDSGHPITFSHLRLLADMSKDDASVKSRKELEVGIVTYHWTSRELQVQIDARRGKVSVGSGRTPALPRTPAAGLQQINQCGTGYAKRVKVWNKGVFDVLMKAGEDQLSETTVSQLQESYDAQVKLAESLKETMERTQQALERVTRVVHGTAPAKAVAKPSAKAAANGKHPGKPASKAAGKPAGRPAAAKRPTTAKAAAKPSGAAAEAQAQLSQVRRRRPAKALA